MNEATYSARMHGRSLDLTFKEFELLKFLAQHPGRVFTRAQLLQEVWGYDYFGGTRTVDVHVRRLRAKLGAENEALIGTVRNVGYRFVPVKGPAPGPDGPDPMATGRCAEAADRPGRPDDDIRRAATPSGHARPADGGACRQVASGPAGASQVRVSGPLPAEQAAAVLDLVRRAAEEDGVSPLSEHVHAAPALRRRSRARATCCSGTRARWLATGTWIPPIPVEGPAGEMVIDPAARRHGLGLILGRARWRPRPARPDCGCGRTVTCRPATRLAAAAGFQRSRALWQMRRSLQTRIGRPQLADGISVRPFRIGQDEDAWVALNRRAFARHPEQGAWTRADLDMREREPWFDPDGFLPRRAGRAAGRLPLDEDSRRRDGHRAERDEVADGARA